MNIRLKILIFFSAAVCTLVTCEVYRLPNIVKPIRYILTMEPDLGPSLTIFPYNGSVVIELKISETTRNITLHKRNLEIDADTVKVHSSNGEELKVSTTSEDEENEIYVIHLERDLLKDESYILTIGQFSNTLGFRNIGFYAAKYRDTNNTPKYFAITDFEPTDARMAFPCFDEPGIKSKFVINVIRKAHHNSVSNQEIETVTDLGDGRFKDTYKETPDMPVYLVAFAVSDYKHTEKKERHRIFGRPSDVDSGGFDYALSISVKILQALEEYTGIKFALDKMDQFAVPDLYFRDDAMENWGLVIYGESHLLCKNTSAAEDLQRCNSYISHEFAHQWFGNLVTPAWWDYTWLSESFAAYFQYYITSVVQPYWRFMDLFLISNFQFGLESEITYRTSPLNYPIKRSGEFPPLNVLYAKGSSIIRMMEHCITHEVFKKGIQIYLQNNKFGAAKPSDLYSAWQKAVDEAGVNQFLDGKSVSDVMKTWDSLSLFPLLTVTRNYTSGSIQFKQEVYSQPDNSNVWAIPVNYIFQSDSQSEFSKTTPEFWLSEQSKTLDKNFPTHGWLLVNKQQTGYYRVNYDLENWERIIRFMNSENFKSIHVLNRAQLIDDAFHLAKTKRITYDIPLRLCDYLIQEKDYIPFAAFYNGIEGLRIRAPRSYLFRTENIQYFENYTLKNQIASASTEYEIFKEYVITALSGLLNYLGFEEKQSDTLLDKLNRGKLAQWLCSFNHPECLTFSSKKVKELKETNATHVAPDIEETIFCQGMRNATEEEFDALNTFYKSSTDIHQQKRLRRTLNCGKFAYQKLLK